MAATTDAKESQAGERGWGCWRRLRYVGTTLAFELVLGCVITLVSMLGTFFAPSTLNVVTHYQVSEGSASAAAIELRVSTDWTGPGTAKVRVISDAHGSCGAHALELETALRVGPSGSESLLADIERAAAQVGLGAPCGGARFTMNPVFTLQAVMVTGTSIVVPLILFLAWRSRRGRHWLINWADWSPRVGLRVTLLYGVGLGIVAIVCGFGIEWLGHLAGLAGGSEAIPLGDGKRANLLWLAPLVVLGGPIFEEYVFRAWMLERFRRVMPAWLALLWTTAAFAAIHVPQGLIPGLELVFAGLLLGMAWLWTRSWLACVLVHAIYNAAVLLSRFAALSAQA